MVEFTIIKPRRANREIKQQRNRIKLRRKSHQSPQATNWDPDLNDQQPSTNSSSKAGEDSSTSVGLGASFTTSVSTQPYSQIIPQNAIIDAGLFQRKWLLWFFCMKATFCNLIQ